MKKINIFKIVILLLMLVLTVGFASAIPDGGVSYYDFDDLDDQWGSYDATNNGATSSTSYPSFGISGDSSSSSYSFDGVNDVITLPNNMFLTDGTNYSFSMWVQIPDLSVETYYFNIKSGTGNANAFAIYWDTSEQAWALNYDVTSSNLNDITSCYPSSPQINTWYKLDITIDDTGSGATGKMYLDGVLCDTNTGMTGSMDDMSSTQYTRIGAQSHNGNIYYYESKIDEVKIFDTALNSTQIENMYDYGTIEGLLEQNITISLKNYYTNNTLNNFTATLQNGTVYNTTTGSIITDILINTTSSVTYNFTLESNNYFNKDISISNIYSDSLVPYTKIYTQSYNNSKTINNFTVTYKGDDYTTTKGLINLPLYNENNTIINKDAFNGSITYTTRTEILEANPYLQNYTFIVHQFPSVLNIFIYSGETGILLANNVTVQITGENFANSTIVNTGNAYFSNLEPDDYTIRFISNNYSSVDYQQTISPEAYHNLNVYLFEDATETVKFTIKDQVTGSTVTDAIVSISTIINNTKTLIGSKTTDIAGEVNFAYTLDTIYSFQISKSNYETKSFQLGPTLNNEYIIWINPTTTYELTNDYAGISIDYYVNKYLAENNIYILSSNFIDNTTNNFTLMLSSPDGILNGYGYNLTYKTISTIQTGSNTYGEELNSQINIQDAGIIDTVKLNYWYNSSVYGYHEFKQTFFITNNDKTGLISNLKNERYGLGTFERVLIVIIIAGIFGGLIGLLNGQIAGGVAILFIFGYFLYSGFLEVYLVALPVLLIIMYIIRSDT